ncbi:hypothetical protein [Pseudomonas sp. LF242]
MDRTAFLAQPDVRSFIEWLQVELPRLAVHLHFPKSRFVDDGLNHKVVGIEKVHALYCWGSVWHDYQTGKWVKSADWASTKVSLDLLRIRLTKALALKCDNTAYSACLAVLQWGGVRGAIPFLHQLRRHGKLVHYLDSCIPLFDLNSIQKLSQLDASSILRFDAGLTKIHSLLDKTGSPIYDSRVGATIAMLYALYRQGKQTPAQLRFPSGAARGAQIRDPGALGFANSPQFFSKAVPCYSWARSQLELGWIIQATLAGAPTMFAGSLQERSHCLEAALFMIGYDLRCLLSAPMVNHTVLSPSSGRGRGRHRGTWVPTSVNFPQVLGDYLQCSQLAGHAVELTEFRQWQVKVRGYAASTAQSYCTPLRPSEFDLVSFSLEELKRIADGGAQGLVTLSGGSEQFIVGDEYEQVYLTSVYLCTRVIEMAGEYSVQPVQLLIYAGFAGNTKTARLIIRTGKTLGRYFDLLDDVQATVLFKVFFGQALIELDQQLMAAVKVIQSGIRG